MVDTLYPGQSLKVREVLASANGNYWLGLQTDGNLVLYSNSELPTSRPNAPNINWSAAPRPLGTRTSPSVPGEPNAYWSTDTWAFPEEQKPVMAVLQSDGQLVLHDSAGIVRWSSGTWGPDLTGVTLRLTDNGNLAIHVNGDRAIWASGGPGGQGAITAAGHFDSAKSLSEELDRLGHLPPVITEHSDVGSSQSTSVDVNGVAYLVTERRRRVVEEIVEHAYLQDLGNLGVWPGQVIQGRPLLAGDVAPIGPLRRAPGTVNIVTDFVSNRPRPEQSQIVLVPSSGAVDAARRSILQKAGPTDSVGTVKASVEKASTLREVGIKVGLSVKGSNFGVDANVSLNQTYKQTTAVAVIRQIFYSVSFTPSGPRAEGLWDSRIQYSDMDPYVDVGNPPLMIDSVQYGRLICVMAQGSFSSSELTAALKANVDNSIKFGASIDARLKEVMENSDVKIYTIGVPGKIGFGTLSEPIAELETVFKAGVGFSLDNPGAPVSFTARHVVDNTLARVALVAEYIQPISAQGVDEIDRPFEVWDGPGGGLVDTGTNINPGDRVSVSTTGMNWSGIFLSNPHGPEGWRGHRADPSAPIPEGTPFALIVGFGGAKWVEAGRFWEGNGKAGRLLLNVNDNNPYNGDDKFRFTSTVNVRRGEAGAAGVFI